MAHCNGKAWVRIGLVGGAVMASAACMSAADALGGSTSPKSGVEDDRQLQPVSLQPTAAPARPGDIAIQEEYARAVSVKTADALELFIARHPEHELSVLARGILDKCHNTHNGAGTDCTASTDINSDE